MTTTFKLRVGKRICMYSSRSTYSHHLVGLFNYSSTVKRVSIIQLPPVFPNVPRSYAFNCLYERLKKYLNNNSLTLLFSPL